jgi:hypothetical protein
MKKIILLGATGGWLAVSAGGAGTQSLFDGKTLDGWIQVPTNSWTVKDGALASTGAPRGVLYTRDDYECYRIMFTMRHVSGNHQACVLIFCNRPPEGQKGADALGGIQFQPPNGGNWDYRPGHNNAGWDWFKALAGHTNFNAAEWSRVEILVDGKAGTARMAAAQPPGSQAIELTDFHDPAAARKGPFAIQIHNAGLFDEYKDITIEVDPANTNLITTGQQVKKTP